MWGHIRNCETKMTRSSEVSWGESSCFKYAQKGEKPRKQEGGCSDIPVYKTCIITEECVEL